MSPATQERVRRIQKLAGEAERIASRDYTLASSAAWIERNGSELSTLLRDLAKRIEGEDEGSL